MSLGTKLRRLLVDDDDGVVESTLRRYFRPQPRFTAPFRYDWIPMPDLQAVLGDAEPGLYDAAARGVIDLANAAEDALRRRRYAQRRRQRPEWPVVVCEGDSWVAHPMVDDIGDHLFCDASNHFNVLNCGAAGDRLVTMEREREQETLVDQVGAAGLVLSGGGNDLLVQFQEFLQAWEPGQPGEPSARIVTAALDARLSHVMEIMRRVLLGVRGRDPELPIIVHGYDYLRVGDPEQGPFLALHFDAARIERAEERQATLDAIVDRYNDRLCETTSEIEGVDYVDLRGTVPDDEWYDEIHPDSRGFRRVSDRIGGVLRQRLAER
ncbi:SGNH/GDSL hydrolase family protein [Paraliomyxa miuraensis]|uniref:SGNH/GDSL hydrolase family protein n=1 Tax=Paraliomyxa miuraensis TaxID=376150 RepID=UPI002259DA3E|nr:SGNH/GDSL hydrolase family protein [Paraliomyxa miuraensis]MCX4245136.1 SGNH/GDSL hydrolase family protein [Paraliomyxa miuraensis]